MQVIGLGVRPQNQTTTTTAADGSRSRFQAVRTQPQARDARPAARRAAHHRYDARTQIEIFLPHPRGAHRRVGNPPVPGGGAEHPNCNYFCFS